MYRIAILCPALPCVMLAAASTLCAQNPEVSPKKAGVVTVADPVTLRSLDPKVISRYSTKVVDRAEIKGQDGTILTRMPTAGERRPDNKPPTPLDKFSETIVRGNLAEHVAQMQSLAKKKTVIIDAEMVLDGVKWSIDDYTTTGEMYLLSDTFTIKGKSEILNTSPHVTNGGTLVIFARRIVREPGGVLSYRAMAGFDMRGGMRQGTGGRLLIACEEFLDGDTKVGLDKLVSEEKFKRAADPTAAIQANVQTRSYYFTDKPGQDGSVRLITNLTNKGDDQIVPDDSLAVWQIRIWEFIEAKILDAVRRNNLPEVASWFRRFQQMPSRGVPKGDDALKAYRDVLSRLNAEKAELLPPLYSRQVTVQGVDNVVRDLCVFVDAQKARVFAAPTAALIQVRRNAQRLSVGLVRYDPQRPEKATLSFDAKLIVDSASAALLEEELRKTGESYAGLFTQWRLTPRATSTPGIEQLDAKQVGDTLQLSLTVDTRTGSSVVWRLASDAGLPLDFDWEIGTNPKTTGGPITVSVSQARRTEAAVSFENEELVNKSVHVASVSYIQSRESALLRPRQRDAVVLQPSARVKVSDVFNVPSDFNLLGSKIPPEAISLDIRDWSEDFERDAGILESIRVRNLLPAVDIQRGTDLRYVEITIVQSVGQDAQVRESNVGPYRLAPRDAIGSEVSVPFFKIDGGSVQYRLEGTAYYSNGSDKLKPARIVGGGLDIDPKLLP